MSLACLTLLTSIGYQSGPQNLKKSRRKGKWLSINLSFIIVHTYQSLMVYRILIRGSHSPKHSRSLSRRHKKQIGQFRWIQLQKQLQKAHRQEQGTSRDGNSMTSASSSWYTSKSNDELWTRTKSRHRQTGHSSRNLCKSPAIQWSELKMFRLFWAYNFTIWTIVLCWFCCRMRTICHCCKPAISPKELD